jgi:hypothetical protein
MITMDVDLIALTKAAADTVGGRHALALTLGVTDHTIYTWCAGIRRPSGQHASCMLLTVATRTPRSTHR